MVGRLLTALDSEIRSSKSQIARQCLLAERAGVLARLGELAEARKQLEQLRKANVGYDAALTCRILLGEGLLDHFSYDLASARDRFRRAYAISSAVGDTRLKALAAAWLSVNELQFDNIAAAAEKAAEALRDALPTDHGALARANLVIADLLNCGGATADAAKHYRVARQHAVDEGDLSMQSLVLYNFAAFRVHQLSLDVIQGHATSDQASIVELDVSSIGNLDHGIGNKSLTRMVPLLHGQVLGLQGKWSLAIERFGDHIENALNEGLQREVAKALTCRALCYRGEGHVDKMLSDIQSALEHLSHCSDMDDLAIVHHRISVAYSESKVAAADEHRAAFQRCLSAFRERQSADLALVRRHLL